MKTQPIHSASRLGALAIAGLGFLALTQTAWTAPPQATPSLVSFEAGTTARAADVNANFEALEGSIQSVRADLGALESTVASLSKTFQDYTVFDSGFTAENRSRIEDIETKFLRGAHSVATGFLDNFNETSATAIQQMTVQAPADGILVVLGTAAYQSDIDFSGSCRLRSQIFVAGVPVGQEMQMIVEDEGDDGFTGDDSYTVVAAAPVTEGGVQVELRARVDGSDGVFFQNRSLTTVFLPFGNSGLPGDLNSLFVGPDLVEGGPQVSGQF